MKGVNRAVRLQRAWNKYGEDAFQFEILEECLCEPNILLLREQHWMDKLRAYKAGFNSTPHAGLSTFGMRFSPSTRKKLSEKRRGRVTSEQTRLRLSQKMKNRVFSEEHLRHLAEAGRRRMLNSPDRNKLGEWSKNHPQIGAANAFYGKHHSEETRKIISENHIGKNHSEETKEKIRQAHLARSTPTLV